MKKHILVVSQYFYPEQFRINDICGEWVKKGYKVTVVTGIPNYPQGKYYPGYGVFKKNREQHDGINIIRIPLIPRGKNSIMLILNYLSFVVTGFMWMLLTKVKADLVFIFEVSPMTQALPGVWFAKKRKIPCYIYVQDLWPENVEIITGTTNKYILGAIGKMVDYIYSRCTKIFATSNSFVEAIAKRGVTKEKILYWPQFAEDFYVPQKRGSAPEIPVDNRFNIVFTGNIGNAQGLDILPKTALLLKDTGFYKKIRFNIIGDGRYKNELVNIVNTTGVTEMFNFIPRQPAIRIPELLACNDVAFQCLVDSPLFDMTIPAKLQSYMACGMPVIASANGEAKRVIMDSGAGLVSPAGDHKKLTEVIKIMFRMEKADVEDMGKRAREYYLEHFNKQKLLNEMDAFLE